MTKEKAYNLDINCLHDGSLVNGEYEWQFEWSGKWEEFVITVESLMKANNWSREKAQEFMDRMIEEIQEDSKNAS